MVTWMSWRIDSDEKTVGELVKISDSYFSEEEYYHGRRSTYVERFGSNTFQISARSMFGLGHIPDHFILEYSSKNPESVIIASYLDEGLMDEFSGVSSVIVNGEIRYTKSAWNHEEFLSVYHSHDYEWSSGDPVCLDYHFGYVYKLVHPKLGLEYRGKRKIQPGEKWGDYKGSSYLVNRENQKLNISEFKKRLIGFADNSADLEIMEVKSISLFKAIDPAKSLNIALGSTRKIRNLLFSKVFENKSECLYASRIPGALESRLTLFFESLTPKDYQNMRHEVEQSL